MRTRLWPLIASLASAGFPLCGHANDSAVRFTQGDWELACDNTRVCRAAGYQRDGDPLTVSVLLTRQAGPDQPVSAELMIGHMEDPPGRRELSMRIDDMAVAPVVLLSHATLPEAQTAALLDALLRGARIEWAAGADRWRLSGEGAAAVLRRMDEFQGRAGTQGAIVEKGARDENAAAAPVAPPVVNAAPVPEGPESAWLLPALEGDALRNTLRATIGDEYCPYLTEETELSSITEADLEVMAHRLSDTMLLVSTKCWTGAYNEGFGYWLIAENPPHNPVLVTPSGVDYGGGEIFSGHRGRGYGDCWSHDAWTWDGASFVHTWSATSGLCKEIAAGGAWTLPTVVTDVRRAAEPSADPGRRVLECQTAFPPALTADRLTEMFGAEQVENTSLPVGEGLSEPGSVIFGGSSEDRLEILWHDAANLAHPRLVRIRGDSSNWRTERGLSLGDGLQSVERLNEGPFRLAGFEWDYAGVQTAWSGGSLERTESANCGVRIRMAPDDPETLMDLYIQVLGDDDFPSTHPAMQALNPRIQELWLEY